jgi:hypothetical protein
MNLSEINQSIDWSIILIYWVSEKCSLLTWLTVALDIGGLIDLAQTIQDTPVDQLQAAFGCDVCVGLLREFVKSIVGSVRA